MLSFLVVLSVLILLGSCIFGIARTVIFLGMVLGLLGAGLLVVAIAKFVYTIAVLWLFAMTIKLFSKRK